MTLAPGPLPDKRSARRNKPTIPTTSLPAAGRPADQRPSIPSWVRLGKSGRAWWRWAWSTPQSCAWGTDVGQESFVARRAALEDDLEALDDLHGFDLDQLIDDADTASRLNVVIRKLAALATGRLALIKEMREMDDRLGLTPKGFAALRWEIVPEHEPVVAGAAAPAVEDEVAAARAGRRDRLTG